MVGGTERGFRPMLKKIITIVLVFLIGAAAALGVFKFVNRGGDGFCRLPAGVFRAEASGQNVPKFLQRFIIFIPAREGDYTAIFPDSEPDKPVSAGFSPEAAGEDRLSPIQLTVEGVDYELKANDCLDGADGHITNLASGISYRLSVRVVTEESLVGIDAPTSLPPAYARNFQLRGRLGEEDSALEGLKGEEQKLGALISGSEAMKARLETKYRDMTVELNELTRASGDLRSEVNSLEKRVILAQRLTPKGELASLSRESLEKDNEWIWARRANSTAEEAQ